jgi:hypothetical protein
LHHAHLAHALNQTKRALVCYRVAAHLSEQDHFIRLAAQAGEVVLLMGLESYTADSASYEPIDHKNVMQIAKSCSTMGGTLEAIGQVVEALISPEILRSKYVAPHREGSLFCHTDKRLGSI